MKRKLLTTTFFLLPILIFAQGIKEEIFMINSHGDSLAMDVYLPAESGEYPAILWRTPYDKSQRNFGEYFNQAGYILVVQDVRGRVKSTGTFNAWIDEAVDGEETVNWITTQDWSNGDVGLIGSSYSAYAAMQLAGNNHPAIKAIVSNSGPINMYDVVFPGGVYHNTALSPWTMAISNDRTFNFPPYKSGLSMNQLVQQIPLNDAFEKNEYKGNFWSHIINHQTEDTYWDRVNTIGVENSDIPILHITGWYDFIQRSAIDGYLAIAESQLSRSGNHNQRMIIGPWIHDDMMNGRTAVGEKDFGEDAKFGLKKFLDLSIAHFDEFMQNGQSQDRASAFEFFEIGTNEWVQSSDWPKTENKTFYFNKEGEKLTLSDNIEKSNSQQNFQFNPKAPTPTLGGANIHFPFFGETNGIRTQTFNDSDGKTLVFTSSELKENLHLFGKVMANLFVSTDALDADFTVKINHINSDGKVVNIVDGIQRISLSTGTKQRDFEERGKVHEIEVDLGYIAMFIPKGDRISVFISGSNYPKYALNPGDASNALLTDKILPRNQTVYFSEEKPSAVILPIRQ